MGWEGIRSHTYVRDRLEGGKVARVRDRVGGVTGLPGFSGDAEHTKTYYLNTSTRFTFPSNKLLLKKIKTGILPKMLMTDIETKHK